MKYFIYIGIIMYMYLSTSVAAKLGVVNVNTGASFLLIFVFGIHIISNTDVRLFIRYKEEFIIMLVALVIIFIKYIYGDTNGIQSVLFFLIVPMSISILIGRQNIIVKSNIIKIVLFFLASECLLAIYERIFSVNIFPYSDEPLYYSNLEDWNFRSTAFLANPLTNALCVSIIMGFVFVSKMKTVYKSFFMIIGIISLLCFNARGATLLWGLLSCLFLVQTLKKNKKNIFFILFIMIFAAMSIYFVADLVFSQGFGGRLVNSELLDGSAMTRLEVFDAFTFINSSDFWFGNSQNFIPVMEKLGAGGVENSYIVIILQYGLIMSVLLFIALYFWIKRLLIPYTKYQKIIIVLSFILVGSMNSALAEAIPWFFFFVCAYVFQEFPKMSNKSKKIVYRVFN